MTDDLRALPIEQLLQRIAAAEPGPSAGSSAALATGLAAALLGKVARLSSGHAPEAERWVEQADRLRERALQLAQIDADVVVAMLTDSAAGSTDSISAPERIVDLAAEVADRAARMAADGNPRLRADARTAQWLAEAAVAAGTKIIESNRRV